jgi:hypothetical protein
VLRLALVAFAGAVLVAGCGTDDGDGNGRGGGHRGGGHLLQELKRQCGRDIDVMLIEPQRCSEEIGLYCGYGAVSKAQLNRCRERVTLRQIGRLDTNAARFASGAFDKCRADAGPFCRGTRERVEAERRAEYYGSLGY